MATPGQAFLLSAANVLGFGVIGFGMNWLVAPPIDSIDFPYKKTALATAAYFLFFYLAIFFQSMIGLAVWGEMKEKEDDKKKVSLWEVKFGPPCYKDRRIVAGNRMVGNTLEQMPIFLVGLWLTAILTNHDHASVCGWLYVVCRSAYPILYIYNPGLVIAATIPNYCTVAYLWITVVRACLK